MNKTTDECIRYVYVPENSTVNIQMIPQGEYYLKLAYGKDWMNMKTRMEQQSGNLPITYPTRKV